MSAKISLKNLMAGLIFMGLGVAFGYAASNYQLGTAFRMGPGYFPLVLAGILVLLGAIIFFQSFRSGPDAEPLTAAPWLGIILLIGALVFFGLTVRGLGLAPSLFVAVFLSAFASRSTGIVGALVMAAALTAVCMIIFVWALGLPLQMIGPWLSF